MLPAVEVVILRGQALSRDLLGNFPRCSSVKHRNDEGPAVITASSYSDTHVEAYRHEHDVEVPLVSLKPAHGLRARQRLGCRAERDVKHYVRSHPMPMLCRSPPVTSSRG